MPAKVDDRPTEDPSGQWQKAPRKARVCRAVGGFAGLTEAVRSICAEVADVTEPHDKFYGSSLENDQEFLEMNEAWQGT